MIHSLQSIDNELLKKTLSVKTQSVAATRKKRKTLLFEN